MQGGDWVTIPCGGVDESLQGVASKEAGAALSVKNLEYDPEGYWSKIGGTQKVGTAWTAANGVVFGVHWFNPRPNQRWLVYERYVDDETSELGYIAMPGYALTSITERRLMVSVGARPQYIERGRWLYHINGVDTPARWDGEKFYPMGWTGPAGSPSVVGGTEAGASLIVDHVAANWSDAPERNTQRGLGSWPTDQDETWRYGWVITWLNDLGMESPPSQMVFASGANLEIGGDASAFHQGRSGARLSIPPGPDWARGVRIYRTVNLEGIDDGGQLDVFFVDEFATAHAFEYIDMTPDVELGHLLDQDSLGPVPLGVSAMAFWHGATWVAVDGTLHYSHPLLYEQFPIGNKINVGSMASGRITGLAAIDRGLVVFKRHGTYLVKGDPVQGYRVETLSDEVGCPAPRTIVQVHGVGTFFLSEQGPYVIQGNLEDDQPTRLTPLIGGIRKTWSKYVGRSVLATSWAVHNPTTMEVWFHVPRGGDARPMLGLVFHYQLKQWSFRPDWSFACGTFYHGMYWLGSHDTSSDSTSGIFAVTRGATTLLGSTLTGTYETGHIQPSLQRTTVDRVHLKVLGGKGRISNLEYRNDRQHSYQDQLTDLRIQEHQEDDAHKWNEGLWGSAYLWVDDEFVVMPFHLHGQTHAYEHSIRVTGDLRLASLSLHVTTPMSAPGRAR